MPPAHRDGDPRYCGAATTVQLQDFVFVDDRLWAVQGDPCSHGDGPLLAVYGDLNVFIDDILIIVAPDDTASARDDLGHVPPLDAPASGSDSTFSYD